MNGIITAKEIAKIKESEKWPRTVAYFFNRELLMIVFLIPLIGCLVMLGRDIIYDDPNLNRAINCTVVALTFEAFIAWRLRQQRRFLRYHIPGLKIDTIKQALKDSGFTSVAVYKIGYFWCRTSVWKFLFAEVLTIIPDGESILVNSVPAGNVLQPTTISIFRNTKKVKKFVEELHKAAQSDIFGG
nr:hypothetical protein [uncultured Mucilaginibacter sp.]